MKICLMGISNVGKTTTGKILAKRLGLKFYDLDEEVKKRLNMTLEEFVNTKDLMWRDEVRGHIINDILQKEDNFVLAITPITYADTFKENINSRGVLLIELYDDPKNIFDRLVFSDENDVIYKDDTYKNKYKNHYMQEIMKDMIHYGIVNVGIGIENKFFIDNDPPTKVVSRIIKEYNLKRI